MPLRALFLVSEFGSKRIQLIMWELADLIPRLSKHPFIEISYEILSKGHSLPTADFKLGSYQFLAKG